MLTYSNKSPFRQLAARYRRHQHYRRALGELQACTNRDLKDLGINRGDIRRLARETAFDGTESPHTA